MNKSAIEYQDSVDPGDCGLNIEIISIQLRNVEYPFHESMGSFNFIINEV